MAVLPDMVGIVAQDIGDSLAFYRLLGLEIPTGNENEPYVEITTSNGYRLSWNSVTMMQALFPDWEEPAGHRIELAFKCDTPAEVDSTYQRLTQAGYESYKEPWDAFWGQRYAIVFDPDENAISLFAPL